MDIRLMTGEDAELLRDICCQAYSENFAHHWHPGGLDYYLFNTFGLHVIAAELKKETVQFYVAFVAEVPVGFMKVVSGAESLELDKLYILPAYKGMKVGHAMMSVFLQLAEGRREVFLYVLAVNTAAIGFYERYGFRKYWQTQLEYPYFKAEMKAAWKMLRDVNAV